jgi:hypothetical protein
MTTPRPLPSGLLALVASILLLFLLLVPAHATVVTFNLPSINLDDTAHHDVYTWRLDNVNLNNAVITGATLVIKNISSNEALNAVYIHLFDTAINSGLTPFMAPQGHGPISLLSDDFTNSAYAASAGWLIAPGTADRLLAAPSFTKQGQDYSLTFNSAQLATLATYIANGHNFAFGIDGDHHFSNDGFVFTLTTTPIPESTTRVPVIGLVGVAVAVELSRRRRVTR